MATREFHYHWKWQLRAPPETLWPLVSDTDRFNRDCGFPAVEVIRSGPVTRRLRARRAGIVIEWEERAFEWLAPQYFDVDRAYTRGPLAHLRIRCELDPAANGGTALTYQMWLKPAGRLGQLFLPWAVDYWARARIQRTFRRYDELARRDAPPSRLAPRSARPARTALARTALGQAGQPLELVDRLIEFVTCADDFSVARLRAYTLADRWNAPRRTVLQLCLHATRAGLLDLRWETVCPHCRGATLASGTLAGISAPAHCNSCAVDFVVNFDQLLELTFAPNPAIRVVTRPTYCVGGPQLTPHIVAQQKLAPGAAGTLALRLRPGRYRVRAPGLAGIRSFRVEPGATPAGQIALGIDAEGEPTLAPESALTIENHDTAERLAIVEHTAWSDQATTAAEVTALQTFRDLFAREALRPGEQLAAGALTLVFTDLKGSTQLYREIGDAPAFGRVLNHFDVLRAAVAAEGGAIVKTMGDAIMAVFPRPAPALRALLAAQRLLASPASAGATPLALKAGLHHGSCLAINQNDRLDYFGSSVNFAARLCPLATGADLVLSDAVQADPETAALIDERSLRMIPEQVSLRGFAGDSFTVWRVTD
ncbi:MAG TPA: DUF5939 domain-containing protein [Opitutaceae bacterium]|nr:DUF5939 domain-containing protein [Opitutaceae bacterium]